MRFFASRWFKAGISLGLFACLLGATDLRVFTRQILAARSEFVLLAFIGYLASQALSAYKWRLLAVPLGFDQPLRAFTLYYLAGMYLNLFAPSTVVGDLGDMGQRQMLVPAHPRAHPERHLDQRNADRVGGHHALAGAGRRAVMLLWVSATGFMLFGPTVLPAALCYGNIAAAFLSVAGWWVLPRVIGRLFSPWHKLRWLVEQSLLPYQTDVGLLGRACGLAFVCHLCQLGLQVLLAHALGLAVPVWYLLLFIPLVHILSALPLSLGGVGVREGGYVVFLALIGIGRDEALAFGLLWSALVLGSGLVGGLVLLLLPEARFSLASVRKTRDGSG